MSNEEKKTELDIQKYLEMMIQHEQFTSEAHQKRVQFFTSFIVAIFAATIAGITQIKTPILCYFLAILSPAIIIILSRLAIISTKRVYQRLLETIIMRGKTEQLLQLNLPIKDFANLMEKSISSNIKLEFWKEEPLLNPRHVISRRESDNSSKFVEDNGGKGYQSDVRSTFICFMAAAVFMALALIVLGITIQLSK